MFYFSPYFIAPLVSAAISALLALFAFSRRRVPSAVPAFWLMAVLTLYSISRTLGYASITIPQKVFFSQLTTSIANFIGLPVLAVGLAVTGYSGWLTRRRLAALLVVPVAALPFIWTMTSHHLVRYDFHIWNDGGLVLFDASNGVVCLLGYFFAAVQNLAGLGLFCLGFVRANWGERGRYGLLIVATVLPMSAEYFSLTPVKGFSMVPTTLCFSMLLYAIAVFGFRLFDLVPVARGALFESLPEPVLILDGKKRLAGANAAAAGLLGLSEKAEGMSLKYAFAGREEFIPAVASDEEDRSGRLVTERGTGRSWQVIGTPISARGAVPEGTLVLLRDVTQLKKAQDELLETLDVAHKANESKSRFFSVLNHEMRTSFHSISWLVELLSETELDEAQERNLHLLRRSCESLKQLMDDALDMSLIESGRMKFEKGPVDVTKLFSDLEGKFADRFREKGLEFSLRFSPAAAGAFECDGRRLAQVLAKLADCALKHAESGTVALTAALDGPAEKPVLSVEVSYEGAGVPPELSDAVSKPAAAAGTGGERKRERRDFGLAVGKSLVGMMGGEIKVGNTSGRRTALKLSIPLSTLSKPAGKSISSPSHEPLPSSGPVSILAVDDVPENLELLRMVTGDLDIEVTEAVSGGAALSAFRTARFDCVLLDIQLPDMNGCEVVKAIRALEGEQNLPRTPVIGISADAYMETRERALGSGCDEYLVRPAGRNEIVAAMKRVMSVCAKVPDGGRDQDSAARLKPQALERIRRLAIEALEASENMEMELAGRLGHSIKGLGMTFGFPEAERLGGKIEEAAGRSDRGALKKYAAMLVDQSGGGGPVTS